MCIVINFAENHSNIQSSKLRGKRRRKAVLNRNVLNAVYLSRYKRRNFSDKIFKKKLIQRNKKI
jgi:hypothetical protein